MRDDDLVAEQDENRRHWDKIRGEDSRAMLRSDCIRMGGYRVKTRVLIRCCFMST